jgi:uncharacterized membrane protein YecN with MAPEG domain
MYYPTLAGTLGLAFLVGRVLYRNAYVKDPETRGPGMIIGFLAAIIMILAGLWGALTAL